MRKSEHGPALGETKKLGITVEQRLSGYDYLLFYSPVPETKWPLVLALRYPKEIKSNGVEVRGGQGRTTKEWDERVQSSLSHSL